MTTRTRSLAAIATLLVAAPMLSACGGSTTKPETVAEGFLHALGGQNADVACKSMTTEDGTKPLEKDDKQLKQCQDSFTKLMGAMKDSDQKQAKAVKIKGATVDGDKATIKGDQIEGLAGAPDISMVKLDGTWYVDSKALNAG